MVSDNKNEAPSGAQHARAVRASRGEASMSGDPAFPYVVKADVGHLPDGSIGLRLTFAESEEAYETEAWHEAAFLLPPATARELAADLAWR